MKSWNLAQTQIHCTCTCKYGNWFNKYQRTCQLFSLSSYATWKNLMITSLFVLQVGGTCSTWAMSPAGTSMILSSCWRSCWEAPPSSEWGSLLTTKTLPTILLRYVQKPLCGNIGNIHVHIDWEICQVHVYSKLSATTVTIKAFLARKFRWSRPLLTWWQCEGG